MKCQTAAMMLMPGIAKAVQATCGTFELATQTDNKKETSERESEMLRCFFCCWFADKHQKVENLQHPPHPHLLQKRKKGNHFT